MSVCPLAVIGSHVASVLASVQILFAVQIPSLVAVQVSSPYPNPSPQHSLPGSSVCTHRRSCVRWVTSQSLLQRCLLVGNGHGNAVFSYLSASLQPCSHVSLVKTSCSHVSRTCSQLHRPLA